VPTIILAITNDGSVNGQAFRRTVNNGSSWNVGIHVTNGLSMVVDLINPFLADETILLVFVLVLQVVTVSVSEQRNFLTAFTLTPQSTLTGGIIKVYGYKNA
jgi:hypothetical protein